MDGHMALEIGIIGRDIKICNSKGVFAASFKAKSWNILVKKFELASFPVGLDGEKMVHREIGRGKEEKRMRGGPYQEKLSRNNFISP